MKKIQKLKICIHSEKRKYETAEEAWEAAAFYFIRHGNFSAVYKCEDIRRPHYHLSTHHTLGDMSHIPERWHNLFATVDQEYKESTFSKLRKLFVGRSEI